MIFGVGVDIILIKRMDNAIQRWGERFINRIFTEQEQKLCLSRANPVAHFSMRFAAKEAFSKALGTGMKRGIRWQDIEIYHEQGRRPMIRLHGRSKELSESLGIENVHVSLSDDTDYAIAMVILERKDESC